MSQQNAQIEDVVRRPYKLWTTKLSYRIRKITRSKSVRQFNSYDAYAQAQIDAMAKQIGAINKRDQAANVAKYGLPTKADGAAQPANDTFRNLLAKGNGSVFLDTVEAWHLAGVQIEAKDLVAYAKACVDFAEPDRLIDRAPSLGLLAWRNPRFRLYLLIAYMTVGRFDLAASLARETLAGLPSDKTLLLRIVGESYHFRDQKLSAAALAQLVREHADELNAPQLSFAHNIAARDIGVEAFGLFKANALNARDVNTSFYYSNLAAMSGDYVRQLSIFNAALERYQLGPVNLIDETKPLSVTNISAQPSVDIDGPLVTVMMSAFNSADTIINSLRSLRRQAYHNLEILVIDDQSTDHTVAMVEAYAASEDDRVTVHRMDRNGGTYRARNFGLSIAKGEFFTCLDSDDWAHPMRIATLVEELQTKPTVIAARGNLIRLSDTKGIKARPAGYVHDDFSSLLYRRESALAKAGYYLEVKTGADSEYTERLAALFGSDSISTLAKPLLIADWSESSLSGSVTGGISDGGTLSLTRLEFRAAYRKKHADSPDRLYVARGEGNLTAYSTPPPLTLQQDQQPTYNLDR